MDDFDDDILDILDEETIALLDGKNVNNNNNSIENEINKNSIGRNDEENFDDEILADENLLKLLDAPQQQKINEFNEENKGEEEEIFIPELVIFYGPPCSVLFFILILFIISLI